MKSKHTYEFTAMGFFGCLTIMLLMAAFGCEPDQDVKYAKQTEQIQPQFEIKALGTFEYEETPETANKGGRAFIVVFKDFTRNFPFITDAKGNQVPNEWIIEKDNKYVVRVPRGKYRFYPVFEDRDIKEVPVRVRPGERIRFGWTGYFPQF